MLTFYYDKQQQYVLRLVSWIQEMLVLHCDKTIPHRKIHKGEIWLVAFGNNIGSEINKTRPAIVLSSGSINAGNTVVVIPIISDKGKVPLFSHGISASIKNGLASYSFAKIDQIRTVAKQRLQKKIGTLETIHDVESQLMINCLLSEQGLEKWFDSPVGEQTLRRYHEKKQNKKKNGT